jgi:nicotinamidase-related amidase
VRDPVTGRLVGLLNVNCSYELTNGLLLPFVTELARSIEMRLLVGGSVVERALLDEFLRVTMRCSQAVVALSEEIFIANAAAVSLLDGADNELLRNWMRDASSERRERTATPQLSADVVVTARCRPLAGTPHPPPHPPSPAAVVILAPTAPSAPSCAPVTVARRTLRSSSWQLLLEQLGQVRAARLPLLLRGERGTGKTVLARYLHDQAEDTGPCTVLDAAVGGARSQDWAGQLHAALSDPAGTVVLRHLDDLDPALVKQTASLVASPRSRLVATATERAGERTDLAALVERSTVVLDVPPLRERVTDIPALVTEIIGELRPEPPRPRCTPEALAALAGSEWPGNVRQLRQVVATALLRSMSCDITADDLPGCYAGAGRDRHLTKLERAERQALVTALRDAAWDRERLSRAITAARAADIAVVYVRVGFRPGHPEISARNRTFSAIAGSGRLAEGSPDAEIHPAVTPRPGEAVVTKRRVSAFTGSDLEVLLRGLGAGTLVLTGIATSGVVLSTLRQAADLDYRLIVLEDACLDADPEVHQVLTQKVFPRQADVTTVAEWAARTAPTT